MASPWESRWGVGTRWPLERARAASGQHGPCDPVTDVCKDLLGRQMGDMAVRVDELRKSSCEGVFAPWASRPQSAASPGTWSQPLSADKDCSAAGSRFGWSVRAAAAADAAAGAPLDNPLAPGSLHVDTERPWASDEVGWYTSMSAAAPPTCKRCGALDEQITCLTQQINALAQALAGLGSATFNWSADREYPAREGLADLILEYLQPCALVHDDVKAFCTELEELLSSGALQIGGATGSKTGSSSPSPAVATALPTHHQFAAEEEEEQRQAFRKVLPQLAVSRPRSTLAADLRDQICKQRSRFQAQRMLGACTIAWRVFAAGQVNERIAGLRVESAELQSDLILRDTKQQLALLGAAVESAKRLSQRYVEHAVSWRRHSCLWHCLVRWQGELFESRRIRAEWDVAVMVRKAESQGKCTAIEVLARTGPSSSARRYRPQGIALLAWRCAVAWSVAESVWFQYEEQQVLLESALRARAAGIRAVQRLYDVEDELFIKACFLAWERACLSAIRKSELEHAVTLKRAGFATKQARLEDATLLLSLVEARDETTSNISMWRKQTLVRALFQVWRDRVGQDRKLIEKRAAELQRERADMLERLARRIVRLLSERCEMVIVLRFFHAWARQMFQEPRMGHGSPDHQSIWGDDAIKKIKQVHMQALELLLKSMVGDDVARVRMCFRCWCLHVRREVHERLTEHWMHLAHNRSAMALKSIALDSRLTQQIIFGRWCREVALSTMQQKCDSIMDRQAAPSQTVGPAVVPEELMLLAAAADAVEGESNPASGRYMLVSGRTANGFPLWRQLGGTHWLFSGANGHWLVGDAHEAAQEFQCETGIVGSFWEHGGTMPHKVGSGKECWLTFKQVGEWEDSPDVQVTVPEPKQSSPSSGDSSIIEAPQQPAHDAKKFLNPRVLLAMMEKPQSVAEVPCGRTLQPTAVATSSPSVEPSIGWSAPAVWPSPEQTRQRKVLL